MEDARKWGLSRIPGRHAAEDTGVWADHVAAMTAFLAVAGQWRCHPLPNGALLWSGLDYGASQAGLALAGLETDPETWAEVRLIEAGAIEELNRGR